MGFIRNIWYGEHFKKWTKWEKFTWILRIAKDKFPLSKFSRMKRSIKKLEDKLGFNT
ncbi:hypothetical protein LCGC14_0844040 [marine sediment metagenome]|uniref:Uncharacterized protein n=1 Tax=marine sediment metagenome TaxID=412755 RepID=A0A0F9PH08_9ZZZZ